MKKILTISLVILAGFAFTLGFIMEDPNGSKTPATDQGIYVSGVNTSYGTPVYTDNFDAANDTTALKARGYKVYYRGGGAQGTAATWFQGNATVFPAFNGPTTGYVAANYQVVTGTNNIDSWLVLPRLAGGILAGDSLYFYSRSPSASTFPDSFRVMYSANDSIPEGTWTELGRFKGNTTTGWEKRGFRAPAASVNGRFAIRYCVVNGGPSGANSDYVGVDALTIERSGPPPASLPEVLYYKFRNNASPTSTPNFAVPGQGTNPATITGLTLTTGGQFDTCLSGTGGTGSTAFINTGWSWNLTGNWTIGFWISNLLETSPGSPTYLFGDPGTGSLRCFYGGAALPNNTIFRGPFSATGYTVSTPMPGSYYIHYVWNGSAIKIYKNGVLVSTNPTTNTMPAGTGFKVGGYSTSSYSLNGKLDEFRVYSRALDSAEIANTWNNNLGVITGVTPVFSNVPDNYSLSQNYPNPFNPVTKINFAIPAKGLVTVKVFDVLGREVATLVNEVKTAGNYTVEFNGANLSSGLYFYKLTSGDFTSVKKMTLIK